MEDQDALQSHWQRVYSTVDLDRASWHQRTPDISVDLIERTDTGLDAAIIDVGGGASLLVDHLLDRGYLDVTVLDVSSRALALARERLDARAEFVSWVCEDVTAMIPERQYAVWHDRALFHFLTDEVDRALYAAVLYEAVSPGGWVIIGTFAPEGPVVCSGLKTCRYDGRALAAELGQGFRLVDERRETHRTPSGAEQLFAWSVFRRSEDF